MNITINHEHSYDSIKLIEVKPDNPKYLIGENGSWSLIIRYCSCGKEQAVDYLRRKDAQEKLELLIGG